MELGSISEIFASIAAIAVVVVTIRFNKFITKREKIENYQMLSSSINDINQAFLSQDKNFSTYLSFTTTINPEMNEEKARKTAFSLMILNTLQILYLSNEEVGSENCYEKNYLDKNLSTFMLDETFRRCLESGNYTKDFVKYANSINTGKQ